MSAASESGALVIERVFEPSAIRRGRLATSPTFYVTTLDARWRFARRKDAEAFVSVGGVCSEHVDGVLMCRKCLGYRVAGRTS